MARDDRSSEFVGVLALFLVINYILVSLRCYCKMVIVKSFAIDDYLSVLTLISFTVFCTLALLGVSKGTGKKAYLVGKENYPEGMKWWWSCEPTYVLMNIVLKLSIGIFLLRIAVERTHRMILWASLISIELYSVFFFLLFTFQCTPISFFWTRLRADGTKGKCIDPAIVVGSFYGYSALSCVTDWVFSIVPIFIVRGLQMDNKKKITVAIILAFCAIGSTATIVRLPFIRGLNDTPEFLYSTIDVAIWSTCETGIGLATSSAATLRPLLRQVFGDLSSAGTSNRKHSRRTNPTRSGYMEHSSQGDNGIPLKETGSEFSKSYMVSCRNSSPSGSTAGLNDWEHEKLSGKKGSMSPTLGNFGITKTVNITQT